MAGIHIPLVNHQCPCAACGKDAFTERQPGNWMASRCGRCQQIFCMACSARVQIQADVSAYACPTCKETAATWPIRLDTSLPSDSVWLMPPQKQEGWPELTPVVYQGMIDRVAHYLPLIIESLKDTISEQDHPKVKERLCFALAAGKYMEWCYNHQDKVREFTHNKPRQDFPTPDLVDMVKLIEKMIARSRDT